LAKNVHQYFYAELDPDDVYHILFQDNNGSISYITMDGQSVRTIPVLNSRNPSVYNKQLYIAPLKKDAYLFYVLQHDNSFMLAYQQVKGGKPGSPKIVDYVSASNIPCSVLYDSSMNIYAFYQSYDGKYLQLGYKKFNTSQRHWSDFTPVTKYTGNCELPHAVIDRQGTIHLCYQRRAPKMFEMVYQQKTPDRNFWSPETVLHSSIHPFENASILQVEDRIIVYWIRDDVIYYNIAPLSGDNWSKPARYGTDFGRRLQCICYKDMRQRHLPDPNLFGDSSSLRELGSFWAKSQPSSSAESVQALSPEIYPGIVSNGYRLAFTDDGSITSASASSGFSQASAGKSSGSSDDVRQLILNVFKQMQDNISEIHSGLTETKNEMGRLMNAYMAMSKELTKCSIKVNMLENRLNQMSARYTSGKAADRSSDDMHKPDKGLHMQIENNGAGVEELRGGETARQPAESEALSKQLSGSTVMSKYFSESAGVIRPLSGSATAAKQHAGSTALSKQLPESTDTSTLPSESPAGEIPESQPAKKAAPALDPEAMKIWEEWKEPREWIEGG